MDSLNIKTAVIITVGNEILSGNTVDSNSAFIARQLSGAGISTGRIYSVSDTREEIQQAVEAAMVYAPLIICTGGLGPTRDDITKKAVAEVFSRKIIVDDEQLRIVEQKFRDFGYKKMPETNISQAEVPEGAEIFPNPRGTAPGILIREKDTLLFMLPGVPAEMKGLMTEQVIPYISNRTGTKNVILARTIRTTGMGESRLAEIIDPVLALPDGVEIAYLPDVTGVDIRLTARGTSRNELEEKLDTAEDAVTGAVPEIIYGHENETLESVIGAMLKQRGLTLAVAESCTGGLVCDKITNVPGSSEYFESGCITYSNESKERLLGVNSGTISEKGAVSSETAAEMAGGIRKNSGCDIGLATTGIAGPGGATPQKPVGLVFVALEDQFGTVVKELKLAGSRKRIKQRSAQTVLDLLRRRLNDKNIYSN